VGGLWGRDGVHGEKVTFLAKISPNPDFQHFYPLMRTFFLYLPVCLHVQSLAFFLLKDPGETNVLGFGMDRHYY
jgi:hypothetical protein